MSGLLFALFLTGLGMLIVGLSLREKHHAASAREELPPPLPSKRRILMFGWEFPPHNSGGLGVACKGIAGALSDQGHEVTFVLPKQLSPDVPYLKMVSAGIENTETYAVNSGVHPYPGAGSYAKNPDGSPVYGSGLIDEVSRYAEAARDIARATPHDLIYAHDWLSFKAGVAAKEVSGKPLIMHVHATECERAGGDASGNPTVHAIERDALHQADRVIAVSQRTKDLISKWYGVPKKKITVVHNGIDERTALTGKLTDSGLANLKKRGYKLVLFMGRLTLHKGPDYFVRAAARVLATDPKVIFLMAGSGDMERAVMDLAASLGIGDRIIFTGFLRGNDQYEACARADLYVMPSVAEPFGLSALEAMRLGTPVLVSKQSGIAEAAEHVLTADFWDVEELAGKMLAVLHDPALSRSLAEGGKKDSERLTWSRTAENIRTLIDGLTPSRLSYA